MNEPVLKTSRADVLSSRKKAQKNLGGIHPPSLLLVLTGVNGPIKVILVYMQGRGFNSFASNMIKLSVNEKKWSSFLARSRALILYISI